ncbi:phosphate ABC transporter substrate-binding protein PstS [Leptolyngbya sp. 'hensonii']|uniref:phosphate ABC transporter substrate-binding protein PstS n=1 Tax=Leptolyngbya sp. 'hensonii' TaxID=1922337 RepID=UPI00094F686C|nr:phosphate ABC transporter substrate-binding protein PstS [Leptolyngbya sp. 'hensonii']OLP18113.1 phosphate ABC transporter substrate-binding protein PstS [Leptolyngbya sp. 'hensonii']
MFLKNRSARWAAGLSTAALAVSLASCNTTPPSSPPAGTETSPQASSPAAGGKTVSLNGAGASFPAPLYQRWFAEYNKTNPTIQISYQSVGSGAGVKQFIAKTVDFGATDAPLKKEEKAEYPADLGKPIQIPMTGGAVVFAYNLPGVDELKLSRATYCAIVDGTIKNWNDPKIVADNKGAKLPDKPVTFVHRSDGSGTTFIFTSHIEKACPGWKAGSGKSVEWPTGVGAKGNEGVTAQVQQTEGAIGYTEYSYAKENGLKSATLQNKKGEFVAPSPEAAAKSFSGVAVPEDFAVSVPDPEQAGAYPIVGLTWLLLYGQYGDQAKADALKGMVKWALSDGKKYAEELGYLPLPEDMTTRVLAALDTIKVASK